MITLYHSSMSRSVRVRWLLEELAIPYQLETRKLAELKTPEYLALHPLGKVPSIRDSEGGDGGLVLYESGAIVQYLRETHGKGRLEPKIGSPERPIPRSRAEGKKIGPKDFLRALRTFRRYRRG